MLGYVHRDRWNGFESKVSMVQFHAADIGKKKVQSNGIRVALKFEIRIVLWAYASVWSFSSICHAFSCLKSIELVKGDQGVLQ